MMSFNAYWLPGVDVETRTVTAQRGGRTINVQFPVLTPDDIRETIARLREKRMEVLARRSVDEIIATLDRGKCHHLGAA